MVDPPQSTEAIAKIRKSLSLPSSEISGLYTASQPASQPNRTYKPTFFKNVPKTEKCAKNDKKTHTEFYLFISSRSFRLFTPTTSNVYTPN
jgi:hypothetical protein